MQNIVQFKLHRLIFSEPILSEKVYQITPLLDLNISKTKSQIKQTIKISLPFYDLINLIDRALGHVCMHVWPSHIYIHTKSIIITYPSKPHIFVLCLYIFPHQDKASEVQGLSLSKVHMPLFTSDRWLGHVIR